MMILEVEAIFKDICKQSEVELSILKSQRWIFLALKIPSASYRPDNLMKKGLYFLWKQLIF